MDASNEIRITARKTGLILLVIAVVLTIAHVAAMVIWYRDLLPIEEWLYFSFFDLDEEESIGTWYSALILFGAGRLALVQARFVRRGSQGWYSWWLLMAIGFHLLSLDEVAGFHEFVNTMVEDTHWTTYGAAIALVVAVAYLPFLWSLPVRTRWLFIISGSIYIGGAVGIEAATIWHEENDQLNTLAYNLWTAVEEFMEMAGVVLFIYALLGHIAANPKANSLNIRFSP
jgi:hypothetical protein